MPAIWTKIGVATLLLATATCEDLTHSYDPSISNGTCYYRPYEEADPIYAPAGNVALGHHFCCQLGDKINSYNVCNNAPIDYTYVAGCTDPTYEDPSCPTKANYSDYQWVGMVKCNDTDDEAFASWVGCPNDGSPIVRQSQTSEGCECDLAGADGDQVLFRAPSRGLDAKGFLPTARGEEITWLPGWTPTTNAAFSTSTNSDSISQSRSIATSTTRSSTTKSAMSTNHSIGTSSLSPTDASTSTAVAASIPPTSEEYSTGAIAGIVVGALGGTFLVFALFVLYLRNQKKKKHSVDCDDSTNVEKPCTPSNADTSETESSNMPRNKLELPGSFTHTEGRITSRIDPVHTSPTPSNTPSSSPSQIYRPFRYQPSPSFGDIQELPDPQRPQWAQTGHGIYGPNRGRSCEQEIGHGRESVHELPG